MNDHFLDKCECGKVLRQCRCIGPKTERVLSPCCHADRETGDLEQPYDWAKEPERGVA